MDSLLLMVFVFGSGIAVGWLVFEKPEKMRNAWDWVKGKINKGA